MKPYASYKPSGVPWLGDVPIHWGVNRLKQVSRLRPSNVDKLTVEGQLVVKLCNYVDVYKNESITSTIDFMEATATSEQIDKLSLRLGDVVVTKDSESPWDIAVPTVIAEDIQELVCGYHLTKLEPLHVSGRFLAWALRCYQVNLHFALSATGITRYGLGSSALADGNVPVPPPDEQQAIADYLDAETARIDTLIHEKDELIGLLREARMSAVSSILLEGMARGAKKASNTKWLGDVPASWVVCRVKHALIRIEQGWSPECENRLCAPGEWGVLKAGACNHGKFKQTEHKFLPVTLDPIPEYEVFAGDVLMSRASGSADLVGSVAYVDEVQPHLMLSDKLFRLVPEEHVDGRYLAWVLNTDAQRRQILDCVRGAEGLARNITTTDIKQLWIALPLLDEQKQLAIEADKIANGFDDLIAHTYDEIGLLNELRAVTIADAVLGRIDVRGVAKTIAACA